MSDLKITSESLKMQIQKAQSLLTIEVQDSIINYSIKNEELCLKHAKSVLFAKIENKIEVFYPHIGENKTFDPSITDFQDEIGEGKIIQIDVEFSGWGNYADYKIHGKIEFKFYLSSNSSVVTQQEKSFISVQIEIDKPQSPFNELPLFGYAPLYMNKEGQLNLNPNTQTLEPKDITFYSNGYQSWSFNFLLSYSDKWSSIPVNMGRINLENQDKTLEGRYQSEMHSVITDISTKCSLLLSFLTHKEQFSRILMNHLQPQGKVDWLCAYSQTDAIPIEQLNPALMKSEVLMISLLSKPEAYETLAMMCDFSGKIAKVQIPDEVIAGWCSWYYYYTKISETEMLSNLKFFKERPDIPIGLIQLDDGYQTSIGDWGIYNDKFNDKFPHGLKWLVDQIHEANFNAGLWVAPFYTTKKAELFAQHPDWALQDTEGKLINTLYNWKAMQYGIDLSRDDVCQFVEDLASTVAHKWGFDFLKIDFLFASASLEAQYQNKSFSRAQVIRRGVEAVRRGLGKNKTLLGCGAPLGPCIGLVDVMRIGEDTAASWAPFEGIINKTVKLAIPALKPALRATIQRTYMHNTLWINDPDCVVVRENNSKLTYEEVLLQLTIFGLSGGQLLISDDEPLVAESRIDLLKRVIPAYSPKPSQSKNSQGSITPPAIPLDLFTNPSPEFYAKTIDTPFGLRHLVAIINWHKKPLQKSFDLKDLLIYRDKQKYNPEDQFLIFDYWNEEIIGITQYSQKIELSNIPSHGCKYLAIIPLTKKDGEEIEFISSTLHIAQGAMEIQNAEINEDFITIELKLAGIHKGDLIFLIPKTKSLKCEESCVKITHIETEWGKIAEIHVELNEKKDIKLQFN